MSGGRFLQGDVQRHVDIAAGRRAARAGPACLRKALAEKLVEDVAGAAGERIAASAAELETLTAGTTTGAGLLAPETCERVASGALEALETRLAVGVDLAAVEGCAALLVAEYL